MARPERRRINLALQGGGAHGAFTWGVLDRLLEQTDLDIVGICGTSAGAMNAAVLAHGLAAGGFEGGRDALCRFWHRIAERASWSPLQPTPIDRVVSRGNLDYSPVWHWLDTASRVLSPYELNPLDLNPLRDVLEESIDFDLLHRASRTKLFLCATNVKTGRIKVFREESVSADAVLASACLPFLFKAVEIDGEFYWDGGYMGNPPIYPLIYNTDCEDVLIVQINPINIRDVPRSAQAIFDRINALSFNSSLMREMRAINFVTRLIDEGLLDHADYRRLNIHTIDAEAELERLGASSKLNADLGFLTWLFELGRERADRFVAEHYDAINVRSSTDIVAKFL